MLMGRKKMPSLNMKQLEEKRRGMVFKKPEQGHLGGSIG